MAKMDELQTPCRVPIVQRHNAPIKDTYGLQLPEELCEAIYLQREKFIGMDSATLYSDGSLINMGTDDISMAFGVIAQAEDGSLGTAISGRVAGFASSTKAELVGLLAAILVSPRDKPTRINIDNMAVVTQFKSIIQQRSVCSERQRIRSPYAVWWSSIHNAYIQQGSQVTVEWVRGHQGNRGNEAADKAAKSAHN
ncbi:hypothetical protein BGZ46_006378, partial [Entomortierella lignicola]